MPQYKIKLLSAKKLLKVKAEKIGDEAYRITLPSGKSLVVEAEVFNEIYEPIEDPFDDVDLSDMGDDDA